MRPKSIGRAGRLDRAERGVSRSLEITGWRRVPGADGRLDAFSPWPFSCRVAVRLVAIAHSGWRATCATVLDSLRVEDGERRTRLAVYALALIGAVCAAQAQQGGIDNTTRTLTFHIPAQPLANALQAYGERAGVQVLYESNSAGDRISSSVDGDFTRSAALEILLNGSGLKVSYSGPEAITLTHPSAAADGPPSHPLAGSADLSLGTLRVRGAAEDADEAGLRDFSATVQSDIQSALQRNARTRAGNYRLVLDLWVDPSRTIQRTELARSTGDRERDATVQAALQGLVISRPAPPKTPQPVRVVIVVKALQ